MTEPALESRNVAMARGGDDRAFAALVRPHIDAVHGFLVRMTGHHDEAKDVLQETLVRVWKGLDSYEHDGRFRAWMFAIARNAALDRRRAQRDTRRIDSLNGLSGDGASPADRAEQREFVGDLESALERLPEARRSVFLMRQESGMTFREIADAMGIPLGTALSHMHHAVRALKKELKHHEP